MSERPSESRLGIVPAVGILVLAHVLLTAGVMLFVAIAMLVRSMSYGDALHRVTTEPLALGAAQLAALSAAIAFGLRLTSDQRDARAQLSIEPASRVAVGLAFLAGLSLQLPIVELTTWMTDLVPALAHDAASDAVLREATRIDSPMRAITVPFAIVLVAPVTEELLFRGLMLPAMRARYGAAWALAITSVLFGLFHADAQAAVYASLMGVALGAVRLRSGSVLPAIGLHAGFNALPVLVPEALWPIHGFNVPETDHVPPWLVSLSLAVAVSALAGVHLVLARRAPS